MSGKVDQEPLFGCTDCCEYVSLSASELRVYEDQCYCQECWEYGDLCRDTDYSDLPPFRPAEQDLLAALDNIVNQIAGLAIRSSGVSGWHLSGDILDWDQILDEDWLGLDAAMAAIKKATAGDALAKSTRRRMSKPATLQQLDKLQALLEPLDEQFDNLGKCFDTACSPLSDAVYSLAEAYLQLIADSVKCDRWMLSDWWLGHSFGREPMMVSIDDEPLRPIGNNAELADFIEGVKF